MLLRSDAGRQHDARLGTFERLRLRCRQRGLRGVRGEGQVQRHQGRMSETEKYPCPCCGYLTLDEKPSGTFDICQICYWEDDNVAFDDPEFAGGANVVSLNTARDNFKKFRASEERWVTRVRPPLRHEVPDGRIEPPWMPSDHVIGAFWDWFVIYASKLAARDPEIVKVLDKRLSLLGEITW